MSNKLTIAAASELYQVSKRTLQRAMSAGKLSFTWEDGKKKLSQVDLERLYGKPVTPTNSAVTPAGITVSENDRYDVIRLFRPPSRETLKDILLEGVSHDKTGEIAQRETIADSNDIYEAIEMYAEATEANHWQEAFDRDDSLIHSPGEYEAINMKRYDAIVVVQRKIGRCYVSAVTLDAADQIQRQYVLYEYDNRDAAVSMARRLTGSDDERAKTTTISLRQLADGVGRKFCRR